jgi:aryl-alcohol dehydrogenase-like predicted oxidoreductase
MSAATPAVGTRMLGRSGVKVSEICLGTMMFGGQTDATVSNRIIDHAADHGVTFIDTADVYNDGRSEQITGPAVKRRRDHWVLATKVGNVMGGGTVVGSGGLSRRWILRAIDGSLARLGLDHIDVYYVHRVDPTVEWSDVIATFGDVIRSGKARYWGISNVRAWHIADIARLCDAQGVPRPIVLQPYYNAMNRQPEVEVLPAARHFGLGAVPYSPIARGVLSGKYKAGVAPDPASRAGRADKRIMDAEYRPESLALAERIAAHAATRGATSIDYAVRWVLSNQAVSSVIAGPRTFEQWQSYLTYTGYTWTADDERLIDDAVKTGHPSTPGYNDPSYPFDGRFLKPVA